MMEQVFNFIVKAVAKKAAKAAVKKGIDIIDDALKNKGTEGAAPPRSNHALSPDHTPPPDHELKNFQNWDEYLRWKEEQETE
jgi:hypothetical protein